VIYVDSSVVLAHLFAEDESPPDEFWQEELVASRLLQYEVWVRVHARRAADSHGDRARSVLGRIDMVELSPLVLHRALEAFPVAVRTLDSLHLASVDFLIRQGQRVTLATYDERQSNAARKLKIPLHRLLRTR
jgi:predicted nucleic acid-binding protein